MKKRYIISSLAMIVVLFGLSLTAWIKPADAFSQSERRPFAQFPELSVHTLLSGDFSSDFEEYATDQFPLRDRWRTLKAIAKFYLFAQKDNNDIYIHDGYASKLESQINDSSVEYAISKMNYLFENYIKGKTDKVWFSVIPDKSATLAQKGSYPSLDYSALADTFKNELEWAEYIDIFRCRRLGIPFGICDF